jgi:hypothetical protein
MAAAADHLERAPCAADVLAAAPCEAAEPAAAGDALLRALTLELASRQLLQLTTNRLREAAWIATKVAARAPASCGPAAASIFAAAAASPALQQAQPPTGQPLLHAALQLAEAAASPPPGVPPLAAAPLALAVARHAQALAGAISTSGGAAPPIPLLRTWHAVARLTSAPSQPDKDALVQLQTATARLASHIAPAFAAALPDAPTGVGNASAASAALPNGLSHYAAQLRECVAASTVAAAASGTRLEPGVVHAMAALNKRLAAMR